MSTPDLVEHHLKQLEDIPVTADAAPAACAHAFATIGAINLQITPSGTTPGWSDSAMLSWPGAGDDLVERLQKWIERILTKLRQLVSELADVLTFSLSVGTTLSLTIDFAGTSSGSTTT